MKRFTMATLAAAIDVALAMSSAHADSISSVEGARAKDRAGMYLSEEEIESLRKYNNDNDDGPGYAYSGSYTYGYGGYGYDGLPGTYSDVYGDVSVYIDPDADGAYGYD